MVSNSQSEFQESRRDSVSRISERTVNDAIGQLLRDKNVRWKNNIDIEKTGMLAEEARKRPDIVVSHPSGIPVIIESEFEPARTVEADAQSRLGKSLATDGRIVEQTIALRLPASLSEANQGQLYQILEKTVFKYCLLHKYAGEDSSTIRWPEKDG